MNGRFLLGGSSGAAFAVAAMLACGDDAPNTVDAATDGGQCECPAAEPPLTGRIVRPSISGDIPANGVGGASIGCPPGTSAIALGGGCSLPQSADLLSLRLIQSGPSDVDAQGWTCRWFNSGSVLVAGTASVSCYVPPAQ
jgi:hypothetical protein